MKQVYPRVEKVSASSFSSRGLFFSSIWTVQPRSDCPASAYGLGYTTVRPWLAVQISEKKSPLSEKEVGPWPFPLGHILVSGPTEHLFNRRFRSFQRRIVSLCKSRGYKVTVHQTLRMIPFFGIQTQATCACCIGGWVAEFFQTSNFDSL